MRQSWTLEDLKDVMKGCVTLQDVKRKNSAAFRAIQNRPDYRIITAHLKRDRKNKYTKSEVLAIARKCPSLLYLTTHYRPIYSKARVSGWLKEIHKILPPAVKPDNYWTLERRKKCAAKCKTKYEFRERFEVAYRISQQKGELHLIDRHLKSRASKKARAIYIYEFEDGSVYVGLTKNYNTRILEHKLRGLFKKKLDSVPHVLIFKNKWMNASDAVLSERWWINQYRRLGWNILNIKGAGSVGSSGYWTKKLVFDRTRKFNSISDLLAKDCAALQAAWRLGIYYDATKHIIRARRNSFASSFDECRAAALKAGSVTQFLRTERHLFAQCKRMGWLDDVLSPIRKRVKRGHWQNDENIFAAAATSSTRRLFTKTFQQAYVMAKKKGILTKCWKLIAKKS